MNILRALLVLAVGVLWAQTVNPVGDCLNLNRSDIAMLQVAASALFQDDEAGIGPTES